MPRKTVPVVCVETGVMYESITEAAETLGLNTSSISHAIRRGNGLHGHHFKYADEGRNRPIVTDKRYKQVPVMCVETGRVYESLKSAAMANGTTVGNISSAINTGGRARGLHFQIAEMRSPSIGASRVWKRGRFSSPLKRSSKSYSMGVPVMKSGEPLEPVSQSEATIFIVPMRRSRSLRSSG